MDFVEMLKYVSPLAILFGGLLWILRVEANKISQALEKRLDEKLRSLEVDLTRHTLTQVKDLRDWVKDPKDGPLALVLWRLEDLSKTVKDLDGVVALKDDVARATRNAERFTTDAIQHLVVQLPGGKEIHIPSPPGKSG